MAVRRETTTKHVYFIAMGQVTLYEEVRKVGISLDNTFERSSKKIRELAWALNDVATKLEALNDPVIPVEKES